MGYDDGGSAMGVTTRRMQLYFHGKLGSAFRMVRGMEDGLTLMGDRPPGLYETLAMD